MAQAFLYTRFADNGVTVLHPAPACLQALASGGFYGRPPRGFIEEQIERQVKDGRTRQAAARFTNALVYGCGNSRLALEIMRDRDCAHRGFNIELIDTAELPDRWFRDAWARSANGGPVSINLDIARAIQWAKIKEAVADEDRWRALSFVRRARVRIFWAGLWLAVANARDEDELYRVWPEGLARHPAPRPVLPAADSINWLHLPPKGQGLAA